LIAWELNPGINTRISQHPVNKLSPSPELLSTYKLR